MDSLNCSLDWFRLVFFLQLVYSLNVQLKNYQEDIVLKAIEIALEDKPELLRDSVAANDIAAYVLNRIPARYIMSERGFTRLAVEHWDDGDDSIGSLFGILMLVNQAVEMIEKRRRPASRTSSSSIVFEAEVAPVHNFPQIFGKVVDASTGAPIDGALVTLLSSDFPAASAEPGWPNPFTTQQSTHGYYSFWPAPVRDSAETRTFGFVLRVEHPDFRPESREVTVTTCCEFSIHDHIDGEGMLDLETVTLHRIAPRLV